MSAYRERPLDSLTVLDGCPCGCTSLDFQPGAWSDAAIIADAMAVYPDGMQAGVTLFGRDGEIVLLELYNCHFGANERFPQIADLRTFGDLGIDVASPPQCR